MPDPWGFVKLHRELPQRRPVQERIQDWREVYHHAPEDHVRAQASRCMSCGIPFCQSGCPLGNLIPEWNDLAYQENWRGAIERLHATNNFPEFTGKLCPAPCEDSCVLDIWGGSVTIKQIEVSIIERAFAAGWVNPRPPSFRTGKRVAVAGSGPAGLAAAQQLNQAGHTVTVYERDDRIGGLIRYGIPDFKMDKSMLDRRLDLLAAEGIKFIPSTTVGVDITREDLRANFDAVVLTVGATKPRDLLIPGRDLAGIHFAMDYLTVQNRLLAGDSLPPEQQISARGKHVVIIGGGDTGADCLGTAVRQGAASVTQFQRWPRPPGARTEADPWPEMPNVFRVSPAHEEGGVPEFAVSTRKFIGDGGRVVAVDGVRVEANKGADGRLSATEIPGTEFSIPADLVLLAIGYAGPDSGDLTTALGLELTERGTIAADPGGMTARTGIFAAGDARRGQSLIVWAIAEGRQVARRVDEYLMGSTMLP